MWCFHCKSCYRKRYNHKIEPAANWEKLLQIQDASKAYEALSVVLKK